MEFARNPPSCNPYVQTGSSVTLYINSLLLVENWDLHLLTGTVFAVLNQVDFVQKQIFVNVFRSLLKVHKEMWPKSGNFLI